MTFLDLQDELIKEVGSILSDMIFEKPSGDGYVTTTGVKGYAHDLPLAVEASDSLQRFMPYFIVRITDGKVENDDDPWIVYADIMFGVFDDYIEKGIRNQETPESEWEFEPQGHKQILTMIQRVSSRFLEEPMLAKRYRAMQDMEFAMESDDTYPYNFGGIRIGFLSPKIGRRNPL